MVANALFFGLYIVGASVGYGQVPTSILPHHIGQYQTLQPTSPPTSQSSHPFFVEVRLDEMPSDGGYVRMRFQIKPQGSAVFQSDSLIRIEIHSLVDRAKVVLEDSALTGTSVCQLSGLTNFSPNYRPLEVSVYWNGTFAFEGLVDFPMTQTYSNSAQKSLTLCTASSIPDSPNIVVSSVLQSENWAYSYAENSEFKTLGLIERLPTNWLELTSYQPLIISEEVYAAIPEDRRKVLKQYVMAGGTIEIENSKVGSSKTNQRWLEETVGATPLYFPADYSEQYATQSVVPSDASATDPVDVIQKYGFGEFRESFTKATEFMTSDSISFPLSKADIGEEYWYWLIPDVASAPIGLFLTLSLGFVFVVAPGILLWSRFHQRRVWMLILMPIAACIAILCLCGIAAFSEGTKSHLRVRSLTYLDAKGNGMAWSRQSAFSQSTNDVILNDQTYLTLLVNSSVFDERPSRVEIEPGEFKYKSAVPVRSAIQFQLLHPVEIAPMLEVQNSSPKELSVTNRAGFSISGGFLKDEQGNFYKLESLQPNATAVLNTCAETEALQWLEELDSKEPLIPPMGSSNTPTNYYRYSSYSTNYSQGISQYVESWEDLVIPNQTNNQYRNSSKLANRSFVVFVEEAPYLQRVLKSQPESNSLHLCVGNW